MLGITSAGRPDGNVKFHIDEDPLVVWSCAVGETSGLVGASVGAGVGCCVGTENVETVVGGAEG